MKLIDKLFISMRKKEIELEQISTENKTTRTRTVKTEAAKSRIKIEKISDQVRFDEITAKAFAYYLFLVFFRLAIVFI
ncbi:MAG: hypothetical protein LBC61_03670 [Candidatus Peribacteria bacterium]|nr:hypothetical protein [Candidatus Peribacteria bacterium]